MQSWNRVLRVALVLAVMLLASPWASALDGPGLGSSWPNARDLSHAPGYHAYRWDKDGVGYVQVNGAHGEPVLALATRGGIVLVLPIGDPSRVSVNTADQTQRAASTVIYADADVTVSATATGYSVSTPAGTCSDPAECTRPQVQAAAAVASPPVVTTSTCSDPAECTRVN